MKKEDELPIEDSSGDQEVNETQSAAHAESSELSDDVLAAAFLCAYAHLASFRGSASFATWLYRIMLNVCRDQLRRRQVRERTIELSQVDRLWADERYTVDPEQIILALENRQRIEQALHQLPATYRATLLLHEVDGLTLTEIADLLDSPLPTVKSRLQRARMAVVTLLDQTAKLEHASDEQNVPSLRRGSRKKKEG
jgi:RNA polymerase sigma-70 factor (ECF subfamily)